MVAVEVVTNSWILDTFCKLLKLMLTDMGKNGEEQTWGQIAEA